MPKKSMDAVPFISKALRRRKINKLTKKAEVLADKTETLSKAIEEEKARSKTVLTAADFERRTEQMDEALSRVCDAAESAAKKPKRSEAKVDVKGLCKTALFEAGKISRASGSGRLSNPEQALVNECVKKGGPNGFKV